jgi:hypothetical protein
MILLAYFTGPLTLHGTSRYNDRRDKKQPNDMISACTMSETFLSHPSKGERMDFNHILAVIALISGSAGSIAFVAQYIEQKMKKIRTQ